MKFLSIINNLVLEGVLLDNLTNKYVDLSQEGSDKTKPIKLDLFNKIKQTTIDIQKLSHQEQYQAWLILRLAEYFNNNKVGSVHPTDLEKYKEYFKIFEEYKRLFDKKSIQDIKSADDISKFVKTCVQIKERQYQSSNSSKSEDKESYVSVKEIQKLEEVGIKFLGISEGYQVFEVPNSTKKNEEAWKRYKNILGRCKGREEGEGIEICTIANFDYFIEYLRDYPKSSYFVLYNKSDENSPYQIHFESKQFKDRLDNNIL